MPDMFLTKISKITSLESLACSLLWFVSAEGLAE